MRQQYDRLLGSVLWPGYDSLNTSGIKRQGICVAWARPIRKRQLKELKELSALSILSILST